MRLCRGRPWAALLLAARAALAQEGPALPRPESKPTAPPPSTPTGAPTSTPTGAPTLTSTSTATPTSTAPPPSTPTGAPTSTSTATPTSPPTPSSPPTATPTAYPRPSPMALRRAGQGDELARGGDWRGALFAYQEAANLDPRSVEMRLKLGGAYERLGYHEEAVRQYQLAAALEPPGTEALRRAERARAAGRGQAPAAAAPPSRPGSSADTPAAASYELGVAAISQGRFAEALGALDEAVRQDPRLPVAFTARASALFGLGRYVEAAGDYRTALALEPAQATPLFGLGECYRVLGQGATAADYYSRYVESTSPDARDDLRAEARRRAAELGPR